MHIKFPFNLKNINVLLLRVKVPPHDAMLCTHDGIFQGSCVALKWPSMFGDAFSNILEVLLPILEYISYLLSDFQTVMMRFQCIVSSRLARLLRILIGHLQWSAMVCDHLEARNNRKTPCPMLQCCTPAMGCFRKNACDVLQCFFQHVGTFAPDFGISQPFIISCQCKRNVNGLQHCNSYFISRHMIYESKSLAKYFSLPLLRCTSQENMKTFHHE